LQAVASILQTRTQDTGVAHELQVDANGGWTVQQAMEMQSALMAADVVLLEQPIAANLDAQVDLEGFAALREHCSLPLVADESCWALEDLLRLAPHVDGVNLKLLKTGGLTEALLMARVARRLNLDLMVGCYSDSTLLNGAACQLLSLIRWPDLDSHLNLVDDPYEGLPLDRDRLSPPTANGLGISYKVEASG
jgi:L-alanine-DL-glutamate epimerase-like enolase superfamily enzyme